MRTLQRKAGKILGIGKEEEEDGWHGRNACAACSAGAGISRAGSVRVHAASVGLQVPLSYENRRGQAGARRFLI